MLCISNHRVINSYKMRAGTYRATRHSVYRRRNSYSKNENNTNVNLSLLKKYVPAPSAPQATMVNRTIIINNDSYMVELPQEFDIYEGLRIWYPTLYEMVLEEMESERSSNSEHSQDDAWAQYDYLEWLYD